MYIPNHVNLTNLRSAWVGHIPFGYDLIKGLKPGKIVELGTHYGGSYFTFCDSVKKSNLRTQCFAVDTWQGEEHAGFYDERVFEFVNKQNQYYKEFSSLLRTTFQDALQSFEDNSIDLLHVDGFHSYDAVLNDYETWKPKLSHNGCMLFHDVTVHQPGFGVHKFWKELVSQYPNQCFNFDHSHGLGVFFNSGSFEVNQQLTSLTGIHFNKIKKHYERKATWLKYALKFKAIF